MRFRTRVHNFWLRVGWLLLILLIYSGSRDLYLRGMGTGNGEFLGAFSVKWGIGLIGYSLIALCVASLCIYAMIRPNRMMEWIQSLEDRLENWKLGSWIIVIASTLFPLVLLLGPWGWRFDLPNFRIMLLVCFSILAAIFIPQKRTSWLERAALMVLLSTTLLILVERFMLITDYPFATSWSEGNRLWDYSLYFARDLYIFDEPFSFPSYLTPGRHGLWGLPFLFLSRPSIVIMRIWDTFLWTFPYLFLGLAVFSSRHTSLSKTWRWIMVFWTFLFLSQGPIYAPLVLSGVLLAVGYHHQRLWQSLIVTALACFYAGISRWTWMVAPAAWAVLWAFVDEDIHQSFWIRVKRPVFMGLAGISGALLSIFVMDVAFPRPDPIYSTSLSQPLLWYRLWSNPTNPTGVVNGLLYAIGPFLAWIVVMIIMQRRNWDFFKIIAVVIVLAGFLVAGLIASVKIGGGSNIHNLDMLLVTLIFLVPLVAKSKDAFHHYPGFAWALLAVVLFLPIWNLVKVEPELDLPKDSNPEEAVSEIRAAIQAASQEGEVLFIDQRQLLTFGEITDVPLVMEYELKDMMNQAMGHNQAYFEKFREDIENHRFNLIVSDALYVIYQGPKYAFGEENDAWVEEVTVPILDEYEPVMEFNEHHIWLLAPKKSLEN
jgi:hypothetical protein